ncbi:MAG: hypothetical protein ACXABY_00435 [Candidatus Thorarchaeota archaeon]|jgi:hypothetical protein
MANVYNRGKYLLASAGVDFGTDDVKCILLTDSATFDVDHNTLDEISANRAAGPTDVSLTGESVTEDDTNDFAYWDADDVVFASVTGGQTIGACAIYLEVGAESADLLIAYYDLTDTPANGGDITIQWATPANGGVLKIS